MPEKKQPSKKAKSQTGKQESGHAGNSTAAISSLGLHFICDELQGLIGARFDKIYSCGKDCFVFQVFVPGQGKGHLHVILPSTIFLYGEKIGTSGEAGNFALQMRKFLGNAAISKVYQHEFQRVLILEAEKFEENEKRRLFLIIELFSRGNIIISDSALKILLLLKSQKIASRPLLRGETYRFPAQLNNVLQMGPDAIVAALLASSKSSVVKAIAVDFSLGGEFAELVCSEIGIDKNTEPENLHNARELADAIIAGIKKKQYGNYNAEMGKRFFEMMESMPEASSKSKKQEKLDAIIVMQEKNIPLLEEEYDSSVKKAESIYSNYEAVRDIIANASLAEKKTGADSLILPDHLAEAGWKVISFDRKNKKVELSVPDPADNSG